MPPTRPQTKWLIAPTTLDSVVKGLDNYKQVAAVSVTFGFDKAMLTTDDKSQLDTFAGSLGSAKSYILEVTGGTDSVGSAQYNYDLSQRRADAVVQYLAAKYGVAPHRFYLIGIGKDQYVADNKTAEGPQAESACAGTVTLKHERRRSESRSCDNRPNQHAGWSGCIVAGARIKRQRGSPDLLIVFKGQAPNGSALCVSSGAS